MARPVLEHTRMGQIARLRVAGGEDGYRPGDVIAGKYRLDWETQEGGMCRVWMAVNAALDLPVAIKFLHRELRCPALVRSLQREARAMAVLHHPAVVQVFDSGEMSPDDPYIVMERLEGEDLRQSLDKDGPLPAEDAVRLLLPIASGLRAAHAHGIVHRDLKPENILVARDDGGNVQPKLLDFGIAKFKSEERPTTVSDIVVTGTIGYMPPEQAFGLEGLDHRADIWAFCAVLYEVISGKTPVSIESFADMQRSLLEDTIPAITTTSGVDNTLWAILERGLRSDPDERWGSMHDLGEALARWLVSRGILEDIRGCSIASEWLDRPARGRTVPNSGLCDVSTQPTLPALSPVPTRPFPLVKPRGHKVDGRALLRALSGGAYRQITA
jgi:serine/threonine-protein kinase